MELDNGRLSFPMTGQVLQGGLAKMVGQQISGGLTSAAVPSFTWRNCSKRSTMVVKGAFSPKSVLMALSTSSAVRSSMSLTGSVSQYSGDSMSGLGAMKRSG